MGKPSNDYVADRLGHAAKEGHLNPEEELELINQLYVMRTWDAPDVPSFTYRLLVEVRLLREA